MTASAALWTACDAEAATGGRSTAPWQARGVSIDSRTLRPAELFVALAGPSFDGHAFVAKAFEAGAAAAMVHQPGLESDAGRPLLEVADTLEALTALGAAGRARSGARLVGVTGSVGKTGTKEALRACLQSQAPTSASASSLNNHWGVPLSLARLPEDAAYGVFEIGMNHPGEIRALARLVRPHVALITTIVPAHTAFFASVAEIAEAKAEIFEGLEPDGTAVLNRDNPFFPLLAERAEACGVARILAFGRHPEAQVRLTGYSPGPAGSRVTADVEGRSLDYWIGLPGKHWALNSVAVLAAVLALGADPARAAVAFAGLQALDGRGRQHRIALAEGELLLIDDSYNANPSSMRAAFDRRIAVLGDMLELGAVSRDLHERLAGPLIEAAVDQVHCCGQDMAALYQALPAAMRGRRAASSAELAPLLAGALGPGDVVLVKGSLGSRMAVIVKAVKALSPAPARAANGE